jgi:hypothetical protein
MSRTIPSTRPCVAPSCSSRIELAPSRRAAALAASWLIVVCAVLIGAVALPLPARIGLCLAMATPAAVAIRRCLLLRGRRAVHILEWRGGWRAWIGPGRIETPVTVLGGSFRIGRVFLLLWLRGRDGIHGVVIDTGRQEPRAFRRLCRQLQWPVSPS